MNKKIKLFTHTDLDGIGCAILAKMAYCDMKDYKHNVDIEYVDYDKINENVSKWIYNVKAHDYYEQCFITDISVNESVANMLNELNIPIRLFDHHVTALPLNRYNWCDVKIDINGIKTCGTELFFNYLADLLISKYDNKIINLLAEFALIVKGWDTWTWVNNKKDFICKSVNDLLSLYGRKKFETKVLSFLFDNSSKSFRDDFIQSEDKLILHAHQKEIDDYINEKESQMEIINLFGYKCGVVFSDKYSSEMGSKICNKHNEIDLLAMVDVGSKKVGYRTAKDNVDLSKLASKFGGGGHKKASGSELSNDLYQKLINEIFKL